MKLAVLGLKILFVAFLYIFLFRVWQLIWSDLRRTGMRPVPGKGMGSEPAWGKGLMLGSDPGTLADAGLVVAESNDPSLRDGDIIRFNGPLVIGRGRNSNIRLRDSFVSHNHARIFFRQNDYWIEDLDSINGTYINGVRIKEPVYLKHGDTVKIAGVTFKFVRWNYEVE